MQPLNPPLFLRRPPLTAFVAVSFVTALALGACSKSPLDAPLPRVAPTQSAPTSNTSGTRDVSVPAADAVLTPAPATPVDPAAGRANKTMSRTQESSAMPLPGQNNDHSAPLPPAKRASSP